MRARLLARGEAAGAQAVAAAVTRIGAAAREVAAGLRGIRVESDDRSVTIEGRGLWRRRIEDARVRWLGAER
ncbi:hypothetical protein [Sphingomonas desiccabilis]|uniref:Uncharacterized protein n=1 Tax=Sphingomonas desiccabilis TaxID=429134 RepID=A0A4Q2IPD0_9SPHN|nr:hypothetical protein [Sphingomonas desiccabilis]MBB3911890.1 hypothetical protein [Sphingomonas desiccabilis]RXZ31402.1 hypothetical protein EO081_09100 [Sphingomonas desiccabilis]